MVGRFRTLRPWLLAVMFALAGMAVRAETPASDLRYLGSAFVSMPTGYVNTGVDYIKDAGRSLTLYSVAPLGKLLEISGLSQLNGPQKGKTLVNAKLNILEEGVFFPSVVLGLGDIQSVRGDRIPFLAASKKSDAFGLVLSAGALEDPATSGKRAFFGVEKTLLPLISLAGERFGDRDAYCLKLRPFAGMSVEFGRRKDTGGGSEELSRILYSNSF